MVEQMDIKRQLRYKDSVYDVLKDIKLGNYNYLIIGKEFGNKYIDIDYVEQKSEEGKIRYISPNSNVLFKDVVDFKRSQSQSLMNYIVDDIKDNINQGVLLNKSDTLNYVDIVAQTLQNSDNINGFFIGDHNYADESQYEESIRTLMNYYTYEFKNISSGDRLPSGEVLVSDEDVEDVYNKLEDTQNFGVSLIDAITREQNPDEYMIDPTDNTFKETNSIFESTSDSEDMSLENSDEPSIKNDGENIDNATLSFQERLYLENERRMNSNESMPDLQDNLSNKTKKLTLYNNHSRGNNAAYITISLLLYVVGSFELFVAIVLLAKFM